MIDIMISFSGICEQSDHGVCKHDHDQKRSDLGYFRTTVLAKGVISWKMQHAPDMMQTNIQTTDYPYPTTNTPLLITHHALIVCEAVRCVCPCEDDRDAKEDDCDSDVLTSDQFGR